MKNTANAMLTEANGFTDKAGYEKVDTPRFRKPVSDLAKHLEDYKEKELDDLEKLMNSV